MLKYLVQSTEQLITIMIMLGMALAYARIAFTEKGIKIIRYGIIAGLIMSVVITYFKTMTDKVDTGMWNLRIYTVSLIALVLFFIFTYISKKLKKTGDILIPVALAVVVCMQLLYFLPFFFEIPYTILLTEETFFVTSAIYKMIGTILGFLLVFVAGSSVYKSVLATSKRKALLFMSIVITVITMQQVATAFGILLAKRIIKTNHTLFVISKYTSNYSNWFIYTIMILGCVIPIILLIESRFVNEPYTNSAERRKILAKWRSRKRWSIITLASFLITIITLTAVEAYANKEIELSPIEETLIEDEKILVSFEQVNDGHLHRFGYTTENGVTIRFIIIQKPNSSTYGVGLDACEICGETGYYEKNGQVVCNLCDVIMNINTIGFKGGCNPMVIEYDIQKGYIVIDIDKLLEFESEFK